MRPVGVHLVWYPSPDITIYELALLMRTAAGIDRMHLANFEQLPYEARRHFQILYNPADEGHVAWVEKYAWKKP